MKTKPEPTDFEGLLEAARPLYAQIMALEEMLVTSNGQRNALKALLAEADESLAAKGVRKNTKLRSRIAEATKL